MKPQPRYQPGDRIGGRYQVHKALMGGMGEVYLCLDLETNYPFALKTFQQHYLTSTERLRQTFEHEVATWVALEKHPNIVRCFYMNTFDNQPFMVLEWIAGEEGRGTDLRGWLSRGPLDLKLALEISMDICQGLIHAQEKQPGLVHRDLKPENILMAQGGLAKITDFGLAQIVNVARLEVGPENMATDSRQSFVRGGGIAGTPAYMAPEQWRDEPLDARTDIYALGCILYEMVTGTLPFRVDFTPTTTLQAHGTIPFPALPVTFAPALRDLVSACLAKAQHDRPATLHVLISRLTDLYQAQLHQPPPQRLAPSDFTSGDYTNRGNTYDMLGQHEQALADFDRAIALDHSFAQAYYNRGNAYAALGQHEKALADFDRAIEFDPSDAKSYSNRGLTYADLGQHKQALVDFGCAIELDPSYAPTYSNRGNTYADLGRHEQALVDFDYAIELDPSYAPTYSNRGLTYADLGRHEQALVDFDCAIEFAPSYAQAYSNRGLTYNTLGQYEQALADFGRAIELNSSLAQAYSNRGNAYAALGQYQQALVDYGCAIKLDASFTQAYLNIGALLGTQGKHEDALAYFEEAARLGDSQGTQYVAQTRQILDGELVPQLDPAQAALRAFAEADTIKVMQQAATRFPLLLQPDFIALIEQAIMEQVPSEERPAYVQRLAELQQIAGQNLRNSK